MLVIQIIYLCKYNESLIRAWEKADTKLILQINRKKSDYLVLMKRLS